MRFVSTLGILCSWNRVDIHRVGVQRVVVQLKKGTRLRLEMSRVGGEKTHKRRHGLFQGGPLDHSDVSNHPVKGVYLDH